MRVALTALAEENTASLDKLAAIVGMPPRQLSALVRASTGASFREYRVVVRLVPVVRSLLNTNEHIAQLAYMSGYEHPSQLDRDFQRVFGLAPRKLRSVLQRAKDLGIA